MTLDSSPADTARPPGQPHPQALLNSLTKERPFVVPAVEWLLAAGEDVGGLVEAANARLRQRGRHLPGPALWSYLRTVVVGAFLVSWKKRHAGKSWHQIQTAASDDLRALNFAVLASADAAGFAKKLPRMASKRVAREHGVWLGDGDSFEAWVAQSGDFLGRKFFENFDTSRKQPARLAVPYLQTLATSLFLGKRTRPVRTGGPNLIDYIETAPRLHKRNRLAAKLAYFPFMLTDEDLRDLRDEYGWKVLRAQRVSVKEIAERLSFKSAAALSRKLYKIRRWSTLQGFGGS